MPCNKRVWRFALEMPLRDRGRIRRWNCHLRYHINGLVSGDGRRTPRSRIPGRILTLRSFRLTWLSMIHSDRSLPYATHNHQNDLLIGGWRVMQVTRGWKRTRVNDLPSSLHWLGLAFRAQFSVPMLFLSLGLQSYLSGARILTIHPRPRNWSTRAANFTCTYPSG